MNSEKFRKVHLLPYNPNWPTQFQIEAAKICDILQSHIISIQHIGSTAISGIYAKPIIDILVVVDDLSIIDSYNTQFKDIGYQCMGEYGISGRRFYWKSPQQRTYHIHLFQKGHSEIIRHVQFRDYLNKHPHAARGYSWIKRCLAEQFESNIESYIAGKDSYIRMIDYQCGTAQQDQIDAQDIINVVAYQSDWEKLALAEINAMKHFIKLDYSSIEHLGSSSVVGLSAKPIIDLYVVLDDMRAASQWLKPLQSLGYVASDSNIHKPHHHRYVKGIPPYGLKRTHHVHIVPSGDGILRRRNFRDILCQYPKLSQQYEGLKYHLLDIYPNDLDAYTDAKSQFIDEVLNKYSC